MENKADLLSLFTWKTKQVFVFLAAEYGTRKNSLNQISLWDGILPTKEHAKFWIHTSNKYRFIDQGTNLRGKEFNLTLHWHVMPKKGKMFVDKIVRPGYCLPLQDAPPQPLNITTNDGTKRDYSVRPKPPPSKPACHGQKRKQEKVAAASALQGPAKKKPRLEVVRVRFLDPDATESSSDDDHTPPVTNGRKRKEVEIVHEIKILGKNPNTKRRKTQETITKTRRKIKKDQKTEEELVGEKIVIKKEIGSSSCGEKVKKPSSTSSTAGKKETKETETKKKTTKEVVEVLWDIPGEIPDLDLLEQEKHRLLYRFFDGIPEDCEDIPPEVKVK
ncbi:hypothetical protein C1H46_028216 [Malus baccata]|uniref:Signal peptidase complex subunit 3 n=1 Tax=Malus baccata TaxID=106549 RepID=A0A540LIN7_MALBA|nr:hypothetical protein C1H46_028216 [Malus baccata]